MSDYADSPKWTFVNDKLPDIIDALNGTDFANLADWLEMPHGWRHSGFNRVPNPPPPGS